MLPSLEVEVTFWNRSAPWLGHVVLMKDGVVPSNRARINRYHSHLVIDAVTEGDEGTYTVKNPNKSEDVRSMVLVVRGTDGSQNSFSLHMIKYRFKMYDFLDVRPLRKCPSQAQFIRPACLLVY